LERENFEVMDIEPVKYHKIVLSRPRSTHEKAAEAIPFLYLNDASNVPDPCMYLGLFF
jgi:hypothetical protein